MFATDLRTAFKRFTLRSPTTDMYMYGESLPDDMAIFGKHSLMYIPLFGVLFWLAGNIFINRGDRSSARVMEEAATIVREKGCSVYMFTKHP